MNGKRAKRLRAKAGSVTQTNASPPLPFWMLIPDREAGGKLKYVGNWATFVYPAGHFRRLLKDVKRAYRGT